MAEPEGGLRPVDVLIVGYLLVTSILILAFPANLPGWPLYLSLHIAALVAILRFAGRRPRSPVLRFVRDWYPIAAFLPLYGELHGLTRMFTTTPHDVWVVGWEAGLFGAQPSQTMWRAWPPLWLSEYLHFAYFYYYFVPITLALALYLKGDRARFSRALTATLTVFLGCCLLFIAFPVAGPYHHLSHPDPRTLPGFFAPLVHVLVQRGSSVGTAFPSSHTAVAVCVWLAAWQLYRPVFWALVLVVPGLALGTVYGGFHYAVDTVAGIIVGVAAALVAPRIHSAIAARLTGAAPEPFQTFASQGRGRRLE